MPKTYPKIYNKRTDQIPFDAVLVDRSTRWGNPFIMGRDGDRKEVVQKYKEWIRGNRQLQIEAMQILKDRDLVCWCAPEECHAEVLMEIANG